jgi:hypothetical protein
MKVLKLFLVPSLLANGYFILFHFLPPAPLPLLLPALPSLLSEQLEQMQLRAFDFSFLSLILNCTMVAVVLVPLLHLLSLTQPTWLAHSAIGVVIVGVTTVAAAAAVVVPSDLRRVFADRPFNPISTKVWKEEMKTD